MEYWFFEASVELGEGEESPPDRRVPHPVQVGRGTASIASGINLVDLHAGDRNHARIGVCTGM